MLLNIGTILSTGTALLPKRANLKANLRRLLNLNGEV
jgi:hypothetical protein